MKRRTLLILSLMLCLICICSVSKDVYASKGMKIHSVERINSKKIRVYFKPIKSAKIYKVEYYYKKSNGSISKAYYKLVKKSKLKKNKKGQYYIVIPAKSPEQYASISYRKDEGKGEWKAWSGYKLAVCNHDYTVVEDCIKQDDDDESYRYTKRVCNICNYVDEQYEDIIE